MSPVQESGLKTAEGLRDWLRELKKDSGASYADIARAIGEEERTVKRWMPERPTTKVTTPRGDTLLRLLDFFGVTLTPPAPRAVALSLMGELRELRHEIVHLRGAEGEAGSTSLLELERRLEALKETAADLQRVQKEMLANQLSALALMARDLSDGEASGTSQ